jgi:hypothetical protein
MGSGAGMWRVIPKRERDAWVVPATMDHSDIRGWLPHFVTSSRGCLILSAEIINKDAHSKRSKISADAK